MGWLSTPALAAAVSNAGGLGGQGMWGFSAEEAERRIAGFQQLSGGSLNVNYPLWPEPRISYNGHGFIESVANNASMNPAIPLIGGTAWAFAQPDLAASRDVLFVDEAGQVSLANLVAMATAARSVVLVGDQMQLANPRS